MLWTAPPPARECHKDRLGSISKQGDRYLRSLFMAGALAVIRYAKIQEIRCVAIVCPLSDNSGNR